jgi:hypothetical protein
MLMNQLDFLISEIFTRHDIAAGVWMRMHQFEIGHQLKEIC